MMMGEPCENSGESLLECELHESRNFVFLSLSPDTTPDAHQTFNIYRASAKALMQELLKKSNVACVAGAQKAGEGLGSDIVIFFPGTIILKASFCLSSPWFG